MHQRTLGVHRRHEVRDRRQGLVVDVDQRRCLGGDRLGERGHARDDLTLEPNDVLGEEGSVLRQAPEADVGQVRLRDHRDDAGQRTRLAGVDAPHPGVGMVGVAEPGMGHAGDREVGRVAPDAGDLLLAVGSDERRCRCHGAGRHLAPPLLVAHIMVSSDVCDKLPATHRFDGYGRGGIWSSVRDRWSPRVPAVSHFPGRCIEFYLLHRRLAATIIFATVPGRRPSRSAISSSVFLPAMWRASARFCWASVHDSSGCSERRRDPAGGITLWLGFLGDRGWAGEIEGARRAS